MTEFRKTLQQGTPEGAAAPAPARSPAESARGEVRPGTPGGFVPPPPGKDELRSTQPQEGHRTPSHMLTTPSVPPPLSESAPGWMLRARRMSLALEEAIRGTEPTQAVQACIERAWAAWELNGAEDKQIARIARLVEQAHTAIRATAAPQLEKAYGECAQVLWAGLPRSAKSRQDFAHIAQIVRGLRMEADAWAAVVDATAQILGWSHAASAHSAHAVRIALLSERTT